MPSFWAYLKENALGKLSVIDRGIGVCVYFEVLPPMQMNARRKEHADRNIADRRNVSTKMSTNGRISGSDGTRTRIAGPPPASVAWSHLGHGSQFRETDPN